MRIRSLRDQLIAGQHVAEGTEVDVDDAVARVLLGLRRAEVVEALTPSAPEAASITGDEMAVVVPKARRKQAI